MGIRKRNIALQVFSADDMSNQAALRGKNKANGRFPAPRALISVIRSKNDKNSSEAVDHLLKRLHFTEHAPLWASYLQHPGPSDGNVSCFPPTSGLDSSPERKGALTPPHTCVLLCHCPARNGQH